jgi:DNA-binding NtrC family response regulator
LDVWTIAATSEDLRAAVQYRRFREDLYQHLGQLDLWIPPLRQRPEDILLLAEHSLARVCAERHLSPKVFAADARRALLAYGWPGNVREVKALIERVALVFAENDVITAKMLASPH